MGSDAVYTDERLDPPWDRRRDCIDCEASNPADAPCCWRCGGLLEGDDA
jgi:hypothetical protein